MGIIVERKGGIETVGELIDALQSFPRDMPVWSGFDEAVKVYRVKPQRGETVEDERGHVEVEGDDGL
jgi:hypothetical protein